MRLSFCELLSRTTVGFPTKWHLRRDSLVHLESKFIKKGNEFRRITMSLAESLKKLENKFKLLEIKDKNTEKFLKEKKERES